MTANELSERFATVGFHGNMITYLTLELNLPLVKASNILTNFKGFAAFTPLIGALIADSFAGRFLTIIASSILYELVYISFLSGSLYTIYFHSTTAFQCCLFICKQRFTTTNYNYYSFSTLKSRAGPRVSPASLRSWQPPG